jgi:hypothetical protein
MAHAAKAVKSSQTLSHFVEMPGLDKRDHSACG